MANTTTVRKEVAGGGLNLTESSQFNTDRVAAINKSVPAANAGTLTTRTDAVSGVITTTATHNVEAGDIIDIYHASGVTTGATVDAVHVANKTIDFSVADAAGSGTGAWSIALPAQDAAVTVMTKVEVELDVDMDTASVISVQSAKRGVFELSTNAAASGTPYDWCVLVEDADSKLWHEDECDPNPLVGDTVTKVYVTHDATSAAIMQVLVAFD